MKNSIAWLIDRLSARILLAVLLASLFVVTLARPAIPTQAGPQTQVFTTPSGRVAPETVVAFLNGPAQSMDVRVKDVQYATGLGAFEFTITFDPAVASILSVTQGPLTYLNNTATFLGSTGRTPNCTAAVIDPGSVNYSCATTGSVPDGPLGSGVLATINFQPGAIGSTSLTFAKSHLLDITGTVNIAHAHKPLTDTLLVAKCGDFNGDFVVTIGDILLMILQFGTNTGSPNWDARFDVNADGAVSIGDILIEVQEFGRACTP